MDDKVRKGRTSKMFGDVNPMSSLSSSDILAIRELAATKTIYQKDIAKKFNISNSACSSIIKLKNRNHG